MIKASIRSAFLAAMAALSFCATARADFQSLAQRLPASTNAVIVVNVAKLVESPYGKEAHWGDKLAESWGNQPVMIPPGAQRLIMAADVKPKGMESNWEASLIEMDKVPSLESIAKDEGGYIDRVWDKDAVCSPINAYFVPMEGNVLASITPAQRTQIAKWVRQPIKPEGNVESAYIKEVLSKLSDQTDIVMAMDLDNAYGVPAIRKFLGESDIKELPAKDIESVARILSTMHGITLEITVDDKIHGRAVVPFDRDASDLKDCAKPIMLAILNFVGMRIDDVPQWTFVASGKEVTMRGELSPASLRHLLSIVQSPIPAATVVAQSKDSAGGGNTGGGDAASGDPGQASKRYYKSIAAILDDAHAGNSLSETATWIRNASRRIDQLPILNVDPALVEWGALVSTRMKQAGSVLAVGQTQISSRVAGVADPTYATGYYGDVNSYNNQQYDNAEKARRQVATEQRAASQDQAMKILNDIAETRNKIRADMVAKYKIEF
jgi:hypothetical protein